MQYLRKIGGVLALTISLVATTNATPVGQNAYTTPGTYSWTAPSGVTSVSVVCVGGGASSNDTAIHGGGGGGLGYKNNISVVPGTNYTVVVGGAGQTSYFINSSTVAGLGATGYLGGGHVGDGGGNGGNGGFSDWTADYVYQPGSGGAGGYSGNGGAGGDGASSYFSGGYSTYASAGTAGSGGGGGGSGGCRWGGVGGDNSPRGGGGVGIFGLGANGAGGVINGDDVDGSSPPLSRGRGGSSGGDGSWTTHGVGGAYGGGARSYLSGAGTGAVRIIWGPGRGFPSTATQDIFAIMSSPTATAGSGYPFSYQITTSPAATSYTATGLPVGLMLNTATGLISGTTTTPGSYDVTLTATNAQGTCPAASLTLTVVARNSQTITFGGLADRMYSLTPFALSASASSGLPVVFSVVSGPASVAGNTVTLTGAGLVVVAASQTGNASYLPAPTVVQRLAVTMPPIGQSAYATPGTYQWICPQGVTNICVVCVGGGNAGYSWSYSGGYGGGGGALAYKNNIPVTPGQSYTVVVGVGGTSGGIVAGGDSSFGGLFAAGGGQGTSGGTPSGSYAGGGSGGAGTNVSGPAGGYGCGGGGAGGYSGNGGRGGDYDYLATAGTGGAGGGGGGYGGNGGGGGVGIWGEGASGRAGNGYYTAAEGGSLGGAGGLVNVNTGGAYAGNAAVSGGGAGAAGTGMGAGPGGGGFGGGGGGNNNGGDGGASSGGNGGSGAVRIIWGVGRSFPSTRTQDMDAVAPNAPAGLNYADKTATAVTLIWNTASDNVGVAGYNIYRDGVLIGGTNEVVFSDSGLSPNTTYNYAVRAYDALGNLSSAAAILAVTTTADFSADNDHDGIPDVAETALGTNGSSAAANDAANQTQQNIHRPAR